MTEAVMAGLVFLPLLIACALLLVPPRWRGALLLIGIAPLPLLLLPLTVTIWQLQEFDMALAGYPAPLGIVWRLDALSLLLLWLNAFLLVFVSLSALVRFAPATPEGLRFWPLWLLLAAGINALLLSADLFNLYVTLELVTLAGIGLIATSNKPEALRAAMRYLLLALMASLLYLLGVGLIYAEIGSLDLYQAGTLLEPGLLPATALVLMLAGLMVKAAIFPLHAWLPAAHGNAPGPVSAMLSAIVVKVSVYIIWRLWFWTGEGWQMPALGLFLGLLGGGAILYGSALALVQKRLKMVIAYSTVAQLGYLMLLFPLGSLLAWQAAGFHLVSHGLAKAALFVAAGNILASLGTDRLRRLAGLDQRLPLDVFTLALASVSLMGLPPSGGFVAKWLFLQAAWEQSAWGWMALIAIGGLLAAAYLFRVLALTCFHPRSHGHSSRLREPSTLASLAGLLLALAAISLGFASAPILALLESAWPGTVLP
ncbi:MAG: proton-conducting membrane transporter [Wenzhouxiangella sp.]|nr:MAG: proton-conducting membrane transporter [Wenzhouxiangella sp.]